MKQQVQFIGFSYQEAEQFLQTIVEKCIDRKLPDQKKESEPPLTPKLAADVLKISLPTLRKYVREGLIRRHDLGPRRKIFYLSELEEDIKKIQAIHAVK